MINIVICEESIFQRNECEKLINEEIDDGKFKMQIVLSTGNIKEVIEYVKFNNEKNTLYFLDIVLENDIKGIELANKIRDYDSKGCIVFITAHEKLSLLPFKHKVQAMDFIIKGETNEVKKTLKNVYMQLGKISKTMINIIMKRKIVLP